MQTITDIVLENQGLIYQIISKYRKHFELDDLYQVAVLGLIKAYKNYNGSYNTKFTSYAYPYMLGEVIKYVNGYRSLKLNKESRVLYSKILKASEMLTQKLMKTPSIYEIALFLEMDEKLVEDIIVANEQIFSLDKIIETDGKNFELYDSLGTCDARVENYSLFSELEKLPSDERKIIFSRYFEDMSQKEVADRLGMYQVEVSRKEKKILRKIKDNIN
jgi:RNA polymerase sporulation-specific sigma factor